LINTGFPAVLRATALDIDVPERQEAAIAMTALMMVAILETQADLGGLPATATDSARSLPPRLRPVVLDRCHAEARGFGARREWDW
jgi:hypothetical protein